MTLARFQARVKVSKYEKIRALQDAVVNLKACEEGISPLLRKALKMFQAAPPAEHVFNDGNDWEVKI